MKNKLREKIPFKKEDFKVKKIDRTFKLRLQSDFSRNCAYCNDRDTYSGGIDNYHIEHFIPKSKFPEYKFDYSNLFYSCPYCNRAKSNKWVTDDPLMPHNGNKGFVSPCTQEYDTHLYREDSGSIRYYTELGKYMYTELKLYLRRHQINYLLDKIIKQRTEIEKLICSSKEIAQNIDTLKKVKNKLDEIFVDMVVDVFYPEI